LRARRAGPLTIGLGSGTEREVDPPTRCVEPGLALDVPGLCIEKIPRFPDAGASHDRPSRAGQHVAAEPVSPRKTGFRRRLRRTHLTFDHRGAGPLSLAAGPPFKNKEKHVKKD
jgi:hypothetical protein